jgi:serine protease AprX
VNNFVYKLLTFPFFRMEIRVDMKLFFTALVLFISFAFQIQASPWWVFFDRGTGWKPGDPVSEILIQRVSGTGAHIRTVSRYFNAVSVDYSGIPEALKQIRGVREVSPVRSLKRTPELPVTAKKLSAKSVASTDTLNPLGVSYDQLEMLGIPSAFDRGYTGKGLVIGLVDAGFNQIGETGCLKNIHISKTRNFVHGGEDISGDNHGSYVLACLGGMEEGKYRGPAYGATFLLAVTDDILTETHADEDRWVAGVEWCDSLGARIISSSLVYNEFDNPADNYRKQDMNGRTSIVAQGAEIAVSRGIVIVNGAGNEGSTPWGIIATPGDAEHVISVGAVTIVQEGNPVIASFSSRGPTADGRIKPDVVAPGVDVYVPILGATGEFTTLSGTSLATPLISGLCAILLEAHPSWTPAMVMAALKASSRDIGDPGPDILYGWGLPDAIEALEYSPSEVADSHVSEGKPESFHLMNPYPNPFNAEVIIPFQIDSPEKIRIDIFDITGKLAASIWNRMTAPGRYEVRWKGEGCASGIYLLKAVSGNQIASGKILMVK